MGMFEKQSRRLQKPGIKTVDQLREEVWAVFNSDDPIEVTSPLVIYGGPNAVPPVTIISRTDPNGNTVPPVNYITAGPSLPPVPPFAGVPVPTLPPWQGIPGVTLDANGLPRPNPTIPGVPPLPGQYPNPIPGVPPPPGVPPIGGSPPTSPPPSSTGGGSGLMGLVLAKVGGQVYSVRVFTGATTTITVDAKADGIDPDSDALTGQYLPVFLIGTAYHITPALFGEYPA